jgi:stage III sporulation protein AC
MDVTLILKVVGVGLLVALSSQVLSKSGKDEQAMLVTVAGVIVVMLMLISNLGELIDTLRSLFGI